MMLGHCGSVCLVLVWNRSSTRLVVSANPSSSMFFPKSHPMKTRKPYLKSLTIAAMMAGGLFQPFMTLPSFAAAGDIISNTATATYQDQNGNPFDTESNTVSVTIAEIAGITVVPSTPDDINNGSYELNDEVNFPFIVTNVGNDTTDVRLPGIAALQGTAKNFRITEVRVFNGTTLIGTYTTGTDPTVLLSSLGLASLAAGGSITVVVNGRIFADSGTLNPGDDIVVQLGDTGPNDNDPVLTQNILLENATDPGDNEDVRTVDDASETNGLLALTEEREAAGISSVDFATEPRPLAFATILKTDVEPVATGASISARDNQITYNLSLRVGSSSPSGSFVPESLSGTLINLNGTQQNRILVSDTIPNQTVLASPPTATASGWTVVYSTSNPAATSPVVAPGAIAAAWTTTQPPNLSTVERIGYIFEAQTSGAAGGTELSPDETPVTGFAYTVTTSGLPDTGGTIANIAQVFGSTFDDAAKSRPPVSQIIFDESGDQHPNNFEGAALPSDDADASGSEFDPINDTGIADPNGSNGTDDGSNTGTGPKGEDNIVIVTGSVIAGTDNIFNGPDGQPDAVNTTDDDDFQGQAIDPDNTNQPRVFTNTVSNPGAGANPTPIDNVTIQPISPTQADDAADSGGNFGVNADIPNGTTVKIDFTDLNGVPQSTTFRYDGETWTRDSGPLVNIGTLAIGAQVDYTVTVTLPTGVANGTNVPIPLIAFPDAGSDGFNSESVNNITVDRIVVGEFLTLLKEVRVVDDQGAEVVNWTSDQTVLNAIDLKKNYVLEYRVTYTNNSPTVASQTGDIPLTATNVVIVEDGDAIGSPNNTWHDDNPANSLTVHLNTATSSQGSIKYYSEFTDDSNADNDVELTGGLPGAGAAVEAYVNEVGTVDPGESGIFLIRRRVN